jgi:plasmid stabilization system protein ParE
MARRFIVRPLAEADLEQAANWYDEEQAGLGSRFLTDVDQVFGRIRTMPLQFPVVSDNIRRALLQTFPYAVYFRETNEALLVVAVLHLRRRPGLWRVRP